MDPNANILRQRAIALSLKSRSLPPGERKDLRAELRELKQALREWLARGGFAPTV
jgi:hypothetical protein